MEHMFNSEVIKTALKDRGFSQRTVAWILNVHPVCVNEVITGKRKNPRIRAAIAMAIGKPVAEIWPETSMEKSHV